MVNLTQEQLAALHGMADQIALLEQEINKAESANLDVSDLRRQLNEAKKVREGLLRVYGGVTTNRRVF